MPNECATKLLDVLKSIADHATEFAEIEDHETMVARIEAKAREGIANAATYGITGSPLDAP